MENPEVRSEAERAEPAEPARTESQPEMERTETAEAAATESQQLADATFEPEAVVEQTSGFQQAEAIETAFVQAVERMATGEGGGTGEGRAPIPAGEGGGEGEGSMMVAPMEGGPETILAEGIVGPVPRVAELPRESEAKLPDGAAPASSDEPLGITPINLPGVAEVQQVEGGPVPGLRVGDLPRDDEADVPERFEAVESGEPHGTEVTPINLPQAARTAGMEADAKGIPHVVTWKAEALPLDGDIQVERRFYYGAEAGPAGAMPAHGTEATPINQPQAARTEEMGADGEGIPPVDSWKTEALPLDGDVQVERRFFYGGETGPAGAMPAPGPEAPGGDAPAAGQPAEAPQPPSDADMPKPDVNMPLPDPDMPQPPVDADMPLADPDMPGPPVDADMPPADPDMPGPPVDADMITGTHPEGPPLPEGAIPAEGIEQPPIMVEEGAILAGEGSEGETWVHPEVYLRSNQDGSQCVVDAQGNPIDNPPVIHTSPDGVGYYAAYAGYENEPWDLPLFKGALQSEGWYVYTGQDGAISLVDEKGIPVASPPIIHLAGDKSGYYASYPGSDPNDPVSFVDVKPYTGPLQTEGWYVHVAQDGKLSLVDANGSTPMESPPVIVYKEGAGYFATYPGSDPNDPASYVDLKPYSAPLQAQGWYVHGGQDGTLTLVDENGQRIANPPVVKLSADGQSYWACYPGTPPNDPGNLIDVPPYQAPLSKEWFLHSVPGGGVEVVDGNGNPVESAPIIGTHDGINYYAKYPASNPNDPASIMDLKPYSAPLQDVHLCVTQSGTTLVVDGEGRPLACQPLVKTYIGEQGPVSYAYYPGSTDPMALLDYYRPKSAS